MNNLFSKVKELNLPAGKYAIFGSGPLAVRGIRESRDVDVVVTEDVFEKFKNTRGWKLKNHKTGYYLENNDIELLKNWGPGEWDVKKLISEAEIINGLPFVKLKEVVKWKKLAKREKDSKDIKLIKKHLDS